MHPKRKLLKLRLLLEAKNNPICPITGGHATVLHEIMEWAWPRYGDKYGHDIKDMGAWELVAEAYFVPELCCLLCNTANITVANSMRLWLIDNSARKYGYERVLGALRAYASLIKNPRAYVPSVITLEGKDYKI